MNYLLGITFAVIGMLAYGVVNYLFKEFSGKMNMFSLSLWLQTATTILLLIWIGLFSDFVIPNYEHFLLLLVSSLAASAAFLCFLYAIDHGNLSIVSPIANSFSVFTVIFAFFFLNEVIPIFGYFAIVLLVVGIWLISYSHDKVHVIKKSKKHLTLSISAAVLWGIQYSLVKVPRESFGVSKTLFYSNATGLVFLLLINFFLLKKKIELPKGELYKDIGIIVFVNMMGLVFFHLALGLAVSVVTPILSASAMVSVILGIIILKEKVTKEELIGIGLVVLGIILVSSVLILENLLNIK